MSSHTQAPSKDAILRYVMKKKAEEEAAKEKRFQEMLNPYKKFNKKGEPDEEFLKSQKKRERLLKKKEEAQRKLQQKADEERLRKQNEELSRLKKQQNELRAMEEKKREEKIRKQALNGKPVDKKMKEYLEMIKAKKEAEKSQKTAADKKREEKRQLEERVYGKSTVKPKIDIKDAKDREKRILENMRKQQSKSINSNPSRSQNDEYIPSKKSTVSTKPVTSSSSVTSSTLSSSIVSTKIPKKPRVGEYSPTRPSIISKSHNGNRSAKVDEYVPAKVNSAKEQKGVHTKPRSDSESTKPTPQYIPSPKSKLTKSDNGIIQNGHKIKARSELFGGDQIPKSSSNVNQPPKKKLRVADNKQPPTRDSTKIDRDALREKERLLKERESQAARELELQKARNKELEEQLAKERELARLRTERERAREREIARLKEIKKRTPAASNKILPPIGLTYRRSMNYQPVSYDDEEEEDEDMRDFIDDRDDLEAQKSDVSHYIREIFGYDKRKYAMIDDDDIEEATFAQQMKEEMESAKAGLLEDLEDMRKEDEEKRRKAKLKKRRQIIDDSDED